MIKQWIKAVLPASVRRQIQRTLKRRKVDEVELLFRHVWKSSDGGVMFDVGAHHGESFEDFALNGWQVFAFEPDPVNRRVLEQRIRDLEKVKIDPRAVSDRAVERTQFFRSEVSTGISSLSAFHESHEDAGSVSVTTLKDVIADEHITKIQFLKIDTEGHDLMVLRGFPWDELRPETVICEFEDRKTAALGYRFTDLANYLRERGYNILVSEWYPIQEYGQLHRWRRFVRYPCELLEPDAWGNLIAIYDDATFTKFCSVLQTEDLYGG